MRDGVKECEENILGSQEARCEFLQNEGRGVE